MSFQDEQPAAGEVRTGPATVVTGTLDVVPKTIQVSNVPDGVHAELCRRAAAGGLSLSDYVLRELERVVSWPTLAETLTRAAQRGGRITFEDAVDAVRWGRHQ